METRKIIGLVLLIVAVVCVSINLFVIYPFISCFFAPLTFWLIAIIVAIAGIVLFFDINLSFTEEEEEEEYGNVLVRDRNFKNLFFLNFDFCYLLYLIINQPVLSDSGKLICSISSNPKCSYNEIFLSPVSK